MIFSKFDEEVKLNWIQAFFLGVVQGLTEFLPVSSSGHLVVFQKILEVDNNSLVFDVAVHLGTLLSVVTVYRSQIWKILKDLFAYFKNRQINQGVHLFVVVVIGSIPTALIGFTLKDLFESLFSNLFAVGLFFCVTGVLLFLTRGRTLASAKDDFSDLSGIEKVTIKQALIIGVAQGAAIAPGVSRSGTTIATGILLGVPRKIAALFSFMLSIPAVMGAALLQLKDVANLDEGFLVSLSVGLVVSYFAGLVGLSGVLHFVKKGRLEVFSVYLWILGITCVIWGM